MFTGIIETVGTVRASQRGAGGVLLTVDLGPVAQGAKEGDSIAINGVCLTVRAIRGATADFDVSAETLDRTAAQRLRPGDRVNLERAMPADGRFGGHIVQGHVDGVGRLAGIEQQGQFAEYTFHVDNPLLDQMVVKGSVAVQGISLTVARMDDRGFTVALIPTTLKETTLHDLRIGDEVNVETDIVVKIIQAQVARLLPQSRGLTRDRLREMGF